MTISSSISSQAASSSLPPLLQSVGLACLPVSDMPAGSNLARKAVAAAVITARQLEEGHYAIEVNCLSDAQPCEFPLTVLLDQALDEDAATLLSSSDRAVLAVEAASRRFFVEQRLGVLASGIGIIDPALFFDPRCDERAVCRRLDIPVCLLGDRDVELSWRGKTPAAAEGVALAHAVSRLILWVHGASVHQGRPDPFFDLLIPLAGTLMEQEARYPILAPMLRARPFNRAISLLSYYQAYRAAREAGDAHACWASFEDGLMHS